MEQPRSVFDKANRPTPLMLASALVIILVILMAAASCSHHAVSSEKSAELYSPAAPTSDSKWPPSKDQARTRLIEAWPTGKIRKWSPEPSSDAKTTAELGLPPEFSLRAAAGVSFQASEEPTGHLREIWAIVPSCKLDAMVGASAFMEALAPESKNSNEAFADLRDDLAKAQGGFDVEGISFEVQPSSEQGCAIRADQVGTRPLGEPTEDKQPLPPAHLHPEN